MILCYTDSYDKLINTNRAFLGSKRKGINYRVTVEIKIDRIVNDYDRVG